MTIEIEMFANEWGPGKILQVYNLKVGMNIEKERILKASSRKKR